MAQKIVSGSRPRVRRDRFGNPILEHPICPYCRQPIKDNRIAFQLHRKVHKYCVIAALVADGFIPPEQGRYLIERSTEYSFQWFLFHLARRLYHLYMDDLEFVVGKLLRHFEKCFGQSPISYINCRQGLKHEL